MVLGANLDSRDTARLRPPRVLGCTIFYFQCTWTVLRGGNVFGLGRDGEASRGCRDVWISETVVAVDSMCELSDVKGAIGEGK